MTLSPLALAAAAVATAVQALVLYRVAVLLEPVENATSNGIGLAHVVAFAVANLIVVVRARGPAALDQLPPYSFFVLTNTLMPIVGYSDVPLSRWMYAHVPFPLFVVISIFIVCSALASVSERRACVSNYGIIVAALTSKIVYSVRTDPDQPGQLGGLLTLLMVGQIFQETLFIRVPTRIEVRRGWKHGPMVTNDGRTLIVPGRQADEAEEDDSLAWARKKLHDKAAGEVADHIYENPQGVMDEISSVATGTFTGDETTAAGVAGLLLLAKKDPKAAKKAKKAATEMGKAVSKKLAKRAAKDLAKEAAKEASKETFMAAAGLVGAGVSEEVAFALLGVAIIPFPVGLVLGATKLAIVGGRYWWRKRKLKRQLKRR